MQAGGNTTPRVLLVSANREQAPEPVLPLGVCLVASALDDAGYRVCVLDLGFSRRPERDLARELEAIRPDVIGLSLRNLDNGCWLRPISYLPEAARLAQACREHSTAPLVIGGPAVGVAPIQALRVTEADCALAGEGEQVMPDLVARLAARRSPGGLPGVWADGCLPLPPARLPDLAALPRPRLGEWLDVGRYLRRGASIPVQSRRGCAFACSYCTYRLVEGGRYRLRAPEAIAAEIAEAVASLGARRFDFVDSTFNHPPEHALAVCEAVARSGVRARLHTSSLNPAGVSKELFALMRRAGFASAVCSPDSGSDEMLANLRRGFTVADVAAAVSLAREAGLPVLWMFMLGGPGECERTVRETVAFIERYLDDRDRLICTVGLRVYPGTDLERTARAEGVLPEDGDPAVPPFYFSPHIAPERTLALLEGCSRRRQMVYLDVLQRPLVPWAGRVRSALHLGGPLWSWVPLYNRVLAPVLDRHRLEGGQPPAEK